MSRYAKFGALHFTIIKIDTMLMHVREENEIIMGHSRMTETLQLRYPDQLELCSKTETRQFLAGLKAKFMKQGTNFYGVKGRSGLLRDQCSGRKHFENRMKPMTVMHLREQVAIIPIGFFQLLFLLIFWLNISSRKMISLSSNDNFTISNNRLLIALSTHYQQFPG